MQIDWGQIVTHVIGFLIAVWLVRRYAWDKLLAFLEHRRETIAASFYEIEQGEKEVAGQKRHYEEELENIEATRREKIQEAARAAEQFSGEIREEARQEAVDMRRKAKQDITNELERANILFKDEMIDAVLSATEKIIKERLDRESHARLIEDFLKEVKVDQ
jgi:F-type H+-transporting ATPase subunit b